MDNLRKYRILPIISFILSGIGIFLFPLILILVSDYDIFCRFRHLIANLTLLILIFSIIGLIISLGLFQRFKPSYEKLLIWGVIGFLIGGFIFWSWGIAIPRCGASDSRRESDIRQINLAMDYFYKENGEYAEITDKDDDGRIDRLIAIGSFLDPIPTDPGTGKVIGCNDIEGAPYRGFDNTSDREKYCVYACLKKGGFFAASHKGIKELDGAPTGLDCW